MRVDVVATGIEVSGEGRIIRSRVVRSASLEN